MAFSDIAKSELIAAIGIENVLTSPEALAQAARDETHGLEPSLPEAVLFPQCHEDVVEIAVICSRHQIVMTPRGAGTGKSGGCVPQNGGVVIDFCRLNEILSVNSTDLTAVVEPGVILGDFQRYVEKLGLFYPPDPASLDWCTLGGNVAENAGGPSAVKYGVTRDYVLGLRIVLADGRNFRIGKQTIKGVTGFDLTSLLCGSEGTLAFVTEITLRLLPKPSHVLASLLYFSSRKKALESVSKVRLCGNVPKCIEYIDSSCLDALRKTGHMGEWPDGLAAFLLVEMDGSEQEHLIKQLALIDKAVEGDGYLGAVVATDEKRRQELWNIRRQLSEATKKLAQYKISEDVVVPLSQMNALLEDVDKIASFYGVRSCAFGHAGDGNLHIQLLFDDENMRQKIPEMLHKIFSTTISHGGTLTGEHGVGIAKKQYLALEQSEDLIDLQRQLKAVFDTQSLLNPGKFL